MAAFSTMLGLGLAGGLGLLAGRKLKPKPTGPLQSAQTSAPTPATPGTPQPPDTQLAQSQAVTAAEGAATRQRRRAMAGSRSVAGTSPAQRAIRAQAQPRTLLGY